MGKLVQDGKVRNIGLSNFSYQDLMRAQGLSKQKISSAQMEYNLFDRSIEEAIENNLGFVPSPVELSRDILDGDRIKPVRLKYTKDPSGRYKYDLVEGRIRYWAWVIAYQGATCIPALMRD